ncbi:MAG: DUF2927 domain-containing protein [Clostridia bacterium]|nr:DUF2927 domain-containing protein [Clostridia bacterium]
MNKRAVSFVLFFLFLVSLSACSVKKSIDNNDEIQPLTAPFSDTTVTETVTKPVVPKSEITTTKTEKTVPAQQTVEKEETTTIQENEETNAVEEIITEILSVIKPTETTAAPLITQSVRVYGYSQKQLINYFVETAMNSEKGVNLGRVIKWTKRVNVYLSGNYNNSDLSLIKQLCYSLNNIDGFPGIGITDSSSNADILIMFAGRLQLSSLISDFGLLDDGYCGLVWSPSYSLRKAVIGINSTIINRTKRNSVICEEFLQAMGIPNDSNSYKNSIFYQVSDSLSWPSKLDWGVVSVLYNPGIKPGMTKSEAREVAASFVKSGI